MGWDSNPRDALTPAGFQDRCLQPLGHPSVKMNSFIGYCGYDGRSMAKLLKPHINDKNFIFQDK